MPSTHYDAWMIADLALFYENLKLLNHQKQRNQTFRPSEFSKSHESPKNKTINLLKSPILTVINLLAERGDISNSCRNNLVVNFEKTNEKIQNILSKKVVKKVKKEVKKDPEQSKLDVSFVTGTESKNVSRNDHHGDLQVVPALQQEHNENFLPPGRPVEIAIHNLKFNEMNDPNVFSKKTLQKHKTVRWVNIHGEEYQASRPPQQLAIQPSEQPSAVNLPQGVKFLEPNRPTQKSAQNQKIQPIQFSFDDIPLKEFMNIRREIHSAFSSIPWTFADRDHHQTVNNHNNISEDAILKNIPCSLKIKSVKHLSKNHRTGVSRPGTGDGDDCKYYGVEAEDKLSEELHSEIVQSKEIQDLISLPEPMLLDAVQEAVSLGLMSVYEAQTLLEIINQPKTAASILTSEMSDSRPTHTALPENQTARSEEKSAENTSFDQGDLPEDSKIPASKKNTSRNKPKTPKNIELHKVAMLNPVVGFEPVIQTETPVVTEPPAGNFTTPVQRSLPSRESKISEKEGTSKSVEAESTEPQPAKLQARPSQNLDSINEEQEVVKFKQAPVKKNTNPDGCQARPCTATFDS